MEAILPFKIKNEQKFYESALKVGYNEMEIYKFIYVMQQSDMDIFPKMHDERINILIYGWELCEDYKQKLSPDEWELPEEMEVMLKLLVPWSMDIWFSKEFDKCKFYLKNGLIHCLNRARDLLMRMPDMMQINWDFLLLYNLKPWNVLYLKNLTVTKEKTLENGAQSIETEELPPTNEDIAYVNLEQLPLIVLRLVKIFDQSSIDMVKTLCMRVIAAWNKIHQTELETSGSRRPYIPPEDKRCLLLICHIYLMAVYESDDVKGYVIDNMINNIRFYYQGFQNSTAMYAMDNLEYTPARFIALTNIHLRVQKRDFFDFFIWNKYDTSLVNLFGVVSQAYKSYLLGNLLMELNNMNEDDFASNIPLYKRLMNSYVNEREKSEIFLLNELDKLEAQRYAHNIIQTVRNVTDFKNKICKGNRMSNIGNYENSDDTVTPLADTNDENPAELKVEEVKEELVGEELEDEEERVRIKESELRLDPIFQNLPNNESILYYVYEVLAKKVDYKGWHFAKIVLLMKIIDHELNMIETWRYHPGLTTDFMLNLEVKLSHHYVDLAKIFKDHPFLEQEFWLTAFYLNPTPDIYETIKRLGMRNNRKRTDEHSKLVMSIDNIDAKYGLLSSTIDVKEIASLANTDDPDTDYDPLFSALHSLRVPDSLVKDMITAIFLPRNRSFAWVVDWAILRSRCKMIMTSMKEKKRFVELNMAEANERLKYLIIDYEKYKNRPQLDYGTIEEGYENLMTSADFDKETDEEEEEEEDDFEDDEDVYESKKRGRGSFAAAARKKEEEKVQDDNSQEDDPFLMGKRRTRARTAATLASFLFQTLPRSSRRKRNQKPLEEETKPDDDKTSADNDDKSSDSKSPITTSDSPQPSSPLTADGDEKDTEIEIIPTKNIKECLRERPTFLNSTQGFQDLIDIWDVEKTDLQSIDENCVSLMESSAVLQRAVKWKLLNKEINPMGCDEQEYIDETEMIIHNAEFAIKMELNLSAIKEEVVAEVLEEVGNEETSKAMEVDADKENITEKIDEMEEAITAKEAVELESIVLEESTVEKVTEIESNETEQNKETSTLEDNSTESINSDMSTVAFKDSGEVSESNTEMHSKRNSVNNDTELEMEKIPENDLNKSTETTTEHKESTETEQEKINKEQLEDEEITQNTNKDEKETKQASETENKADTSTKESETNEKPSKDTEIKITDELNKTDLENKIEANEKQPKQEENKDLATESISEKSTDVEKSMEMDLDKLTTIDKATNQTEEKAEDASLKLTEVPETSEIKEVKNEKPAKDKDSNQLKQAKDSNEILLDKDKSLQEVNSKDTNKTDIKTSQTLENEDKEANKTEDKPNEEHQITKETLEKDLELNTEDSTTANKEDKVISCETHPKGEETLESETIDKDSHSQSLQEDLNIILHYSSGEELDKSDNETEKLTVASVKSEDNQESTDSDTRNLKNLCLTKNVKVLVRKLRAADLTSLRQPKVKILRVNYDKYAEEFRNKRRRITNKAYLDIDDSSNHSYGTNTSSSDAYRPSRVKRKIPLRRHSMRQAMRTSESDNDDSTNSDDLKLSTMVLKTKVRNRRLSTPSSSQSSTFAAVSSSSKRALGPKSTRYAAGPKSTRHTAGPKSAKHNLVVIPRSASGLKLRISNAEQTTQETGVGKTRSSTSIEYDEIIQLSSSSSDACIVNELAPIVEEVIEVDDHPLFEEEMVI
ncbi:FK506-binding protein 5 isoform X2 [Calliphora vicina]|uniref:FK506-binding protein 5 isoform X2 n=1 Tax=Calliphora vicina TaxID=7373 RepID=UPI00325B984D